MLAFKTKNAQIEKLPFFIGGQLLLIVLIQFTLGFFVLPIARAQETFDKDTFDTLLDDADKRIKDLRKKRLQRDADLFKEEAEAKQSDELRRKRPIFGSKKVDSGDNDDGDNDDEDKNKIFETSIKKRVRDRQLNVTLRLDVDDDDQLDSMKPAKERDEDKELAKRREERREAFNALTDKPYYVMDWVPSNPDGTSNGAFGLLDGNGRPVPYHLNGFPNLQRKFPWDLGN